MSDKRKARAIERLLDEAVEPDTNDFQRGRKTEQARKMAEELRKDLPVPEGPDEARMEDSEK